MGMFLTKAGDFPVSRTRSTYVGKKFHFMGYGFLKDMFSSKGIPITEVDSIEVKGQDKEFKAGKAIGAGALGAIALGPIGLFAAALGKNNKALVGIYFKDGRKALIETSGSTLNEIIKDLEVANF